MGGLLNGCGAAAWRESCAIDCVDEGGMGGASVLGHLTTPDWRGVLILSSHCNTGLGLFIGVGGPASAV